MGRRDVLPPKEFADQIWGPGFVQLDFEDEPIKYDCIVLGTPGDDVMLCDSVWLMEEVGEPGEEEHRLKHFAPGQYDAIFAEWDDVTGRPIFERAVVVRAPKTKQTTKESHPEEVSNEEDSSEESHPEADEGSHPEKPS